MKNNTKRDYFFEHEEEIAEIAKKYGARGGLLTFNEFVERHKDCKLNYQDFMYCARKSGHIANILKLKRSGLAEKNDNASKERRAPSDAKENLREMILLNKDKIAAASFQKLHRLSNAIVQMNAVNMEIFTPFLSKKYGSEVLNNYIDAVNDINEACMKASARSTGFPASLVPAQALFLGAFGIGLNPHILLAVLAIYGSQINEDVYGDELLFESLGEGFEQRFENAVEQFHDAVQYTEFTALDLEQLAELL